MFQYPRRFALLVGTAAEQKECLSDLAALDAVLPAALAETQAAWKKIIARTPMLWTLCQDIVRALRS
eukprot:2549929-Prorocentrum_lima.AAC.1